jgi:hypothetical protein
LSDSTFELQQTYSLKVPKACRSHPFMSPFQLLHDRVLAATADLSFADRILTGSVLTGGGGGGGVFWGGGGGGGASFLSSQFYDGMFVSLASF